MKNEYSAMQQLASSKEQAKRDYVASRNAVTSFEESERLKRMNEIFWRGVMRFITCVTIVFIAAYMFFNFM